MSHSLIVVLQDMSQALTAQNSELRGMLIKATETKALNPDANVENAQREDVVSTQFDKCSLDSNGDLSQGHVFNKTRLTFVSIFSAYVRSAHFEQCSHISIR